MRRLWRLLTYRPIVVYHTAPPGFAGAGLPMRVPRWERFTRPRYHFTVQYRGIDDDDWRPVTIEADPVRNRFGRLLALRLDFSEVVDMSDPDTAYYVDDLGIYNY